MVPLNTPLRVDASLSVLINGTLSGGGWTADFFNSLTFNPDAFFDILTPGVTANSVGVNWLVDNQLGGGVVTVPEPSTFGLFGAGLLALGFMRRKRVV